MPGPNLVDGQGFSSQEFLKSKTYDGFSGTLALDQNGVVANSYNTKIVKAGTVLARITESTRSTYQQLIPRVSAPTYGPGSDVAVGILLTDADLTDMDKNIGYMTRGDVWDDRIIDEGSFGSSAATRTTLTHIQFLDLE